jgi:hypothetical protein
MSYNLQALRPPESTFETFFVRQAISQQKEKDKVVVKNI